MKYQKRTFEHVWAEWFESRWDERTERFHREKNHSSNCTVVDSSRSQVTILFPEGDCIRKKKGSAGLRINGVRAVDFLRSPSECRPPAKSAPRSPIESKTVLLGDGTPFQKSISNLALNNSPSTNGQTHGKCNKKTKKSSAPEDRSA